MTGTEGWQETRGPAGTHFWALLAEQPAPCAGTDPAWWHPVHPRTTTARQVEADLIRKALRLCAACPHRAPCLAAALEERDGHAIRGGTLPADRNRRRR